MNRPNPQSRRAVLAAMAVLALWPLPQVRHAHAQDVGGGSAEGGAAVSEEITTETVMAVQRKLNALGYSVGAVDGILGPRTRSALQAYQWKNGLPADGVLDRALSQAILSET